MVNPEEATLYQRPPEHDPTLWERAVLNNPDPKVFVPALAVGLEDVQKRVDQQSQFAEGQLHKLEVSWIEGRGKKRKFQIEI